MTEAQKYRYYFPAWNRCALEQQWRTVKGRLVASRPEGLGSEEPERLLAQVWGFAAQRAQARRSAILPDDLRHACHIVASLRLGNGARDKSSAALSHAEVNQVVALFDLLAEYARWERGEDNQVVRCVTRWVDPRIAEREGFVAFLRARDPSEAALRAISENAYGTANWEALDMQQLRWLAAQVKSRNRPAKEKEEYADCPF